MTLTMDQRWLLLTIGGWLIADALLSESGRKTLASRQPGGSLLRFRETDGPQLCSYSFTDGCLRSGMVGPPRVKVSLKEMGRFGDQISAAARAKLTAIRLEQNAEASRVYRWCGCGHPAECLRANAGDPLYGDRHHYSEDEWLDHVATSRDLADQLQVALRDALGLTPDAPRQLDLFGAVSA